MVKLIGGVTFLYYAADGLQPTYLNKSLMCEPIRNPLGNDIRGSGTRSSCKSENLTPLLELRNGNRACFLRCRRCGCCGCCVVDGVSLYFQW